MFLIPFLIGASATGYVWYNSSQEPTEPTFKDELLKVLKPVGITLVVLLLLRWLYVKGSAQTPKP